MLRDEVYNKQGTREREGNGLEFCEDSVGKGHDRDKMEINVFGIY
jgi:hypothetical protein